MWQSQKWAEMALTTTICFKKSELHRVLKATCFLKIKTRKKRVLKIKEHLYLTKSLFNTKQCTYKIYFGFENT